MIKIEITEPHLIHPNELKRLTDYLHGGSGDMQRDAAGILDQVLDRAGVPPNEVLGAIDALRAKEAALLRIHAALGVTFGDDIYKVIESLQAASAEFATATLGSAPDPARTMMQLMPGMPFISSAPASLPTAPIEVPVFTQAPLASVELDSKGMPWDARIHAATKAKIGDGTWRYKRGTPDTVIAPIEAEIRATMSAPGIPAAPAAPVPSAPAPAPAVSPAAPVVPVAPVVASASAVPPAPTGDAFSKLMTWLTPRLASGSITAERVSAIVRELGLPHVGALFTRQDLIPAAKERIEAVIAAGGAA